jgi:hypothetical protein
VINVVINVVTQLLLEYREILIRFPAGTKDLFLLQSFHIEYENTAASWEPFLHG